MSAATPPNGIPLIRHAARRESLLPRLPPVDEQSYGELDAYPLRRSSAVCKATGGGRWEPKQSSPEPGYRIPFTGKPGCLGLAPFELDMEREEEKERIRRMNPIVKDGQFQYRFPEYREPGMDPVASAASY